MIRDEALQSKLLLFPKPVLFGSFPCDPYLLIACLQTAAGRYELAKTM